MTHETFVEKCLNRFDDGLMNREKNHIINYIQCKLIEEFSEVLAIHTKSYYHTKKFPDVDRIKDELGDVYFYLAVWQIIGRRKEKVTDDFYRWTPPQSVDLTAIDIGEVMQILINVINILSEIPLDFDGKINKQNVKIGIDQYLEAKSANVINILSEIFLGFKGKFNKQNIKTMLDQYLEAKSENVINILSEIPLDFDRKNNEKNVKIGLDQYLEAKSVLEIISNFYKLSFDEIRKANDEKLMKRHGEKYNPEYYQKRRVK